jgi:hypothetical protein
MFVLGASRTRLSSNVCILLDDRQRNVKAPAEGGFLERGESSAREMRRYFGREGSTA